MYNGSDASQGFKCEIWIPILLFTLLLISCEGAGDHKSKDRWCTISQVSLGKTLYQENCLSCHGVRGKGTANWKERLPDGALPPPPLDGTGHTWHHSRELLLRIVNHGGKLYDGKMPGFKDKLTESEQVAVLAYIQSLWSDQVYSFWKEQEDKK